MMPTFRNILIVFLALLLGACAIQLVPDYDPTLVERLDKANTETLTLFAALEDVPEFPAYGKYEDSYSKLIGEFDALRMRAASRPVPPLAKRISKISIVKETCNSQDDPDGCVNASPSSIGRVLIILRKMRSEHQDGDLDSDGVKGLRNSYDQAIDMALTVENALKR